MRFLKMMVFPGVLVIVVAMLLLRLGVTRAAPASTCGTWSIVSSPNPGSIVSVLEGVTALSANNVWAVGYVSNSGGPDPALIEHWDGTSWSVVKSSNIAGRGNYLYGVAAVSANNMWAVGETLNSKGVSQTLIEHWDGTAWSIVASPNPAPYDALGGVTVVSADNVWAVGSVLSSDQLIQQTLIEHWDGTSWSVVSSPNPSTSYNFLSGVTAISARNIWAVGGYSTPGHPSQTLIEHWNGTSWSVVASPDPVSGLTVNLNGVAKVPGTGNVWAVGRSYVNNVGEQTLVEYWNGTSWSIVASPNDPVKKSSILSAVAVVSANDVWVVGYAYGPNPNKALIEHWDGTSWSVVSTPNPRSLELAGVTRVPGTTQAWAVGDNGASRSTVKTLTEFYC